MVCSPLDAYADSHPQTQVYFPPLIFFSSTSCQLPSSIFTVTLLEFPAGRPEAVPFTTMPPVTSSPSFGSSISTELLAALAYTLHPINRMQSIKAARNEVLVLRSAFFRRYDCMSCPPVLVKVIWIICLLLLSGSKYSFCLSLRRPLYWIVFPRYTL